MANIKKTEELLNSFRMCMCGKYLQEGAYCLCCENRYDVIAKKWDETLGKLFDRKKNNEN